MVAKLFYIEHGCTEKDCDGEIVSQSNGVKTVRKTLLAIPGRKIPMAFDSRTAALEWAQSHGYEVQE